MEKTLVLIFLFSLSSFATCYERLTDGFRDSAHFTQHSTEVYSNPSEELDERMAYNAVSKTLRELECSIKTQLEHVQCSESLNTVICRVDIKYGYFIIVKDYVDTVNLLFNRWD